MLYVLLFAVEISQNQRKEEIHVFLLWCSLAFKVHYQIVVAIFPTGLEGSMSSCSSSKMHAALFV